MKSSTPCPPSHPAWQPTALVAMHALAALLLLSYVWPVTAVYWQAIDARTFFMLNGSLNGAGTWEFLWAWSNTRYHDLLVGLFILACLIYPIAGFRREQLHAAFFRCSAMMLVVLAARWLFDLVADGFGWGGASPSLVLAPAVRLSELFPGVPLKDASSDSFPGDHATILVAWAGFVLLHSRRWNCWLAALLPLAMVLPRLVAGAHWLSDVLVGGLVVALPVLSWTYYSPCIRYLAGKLERMSEPVWRRLSLTPWFRDQHFFIHGPGAGRAPAK